MTAPSARLIYCKGWDEATIRIQKKETDLVLIVTSTQKGYYAVRNKHKEKWTDIPGGWLEDVSFFKDEPANSELDLKRIIDEYYRNLLSK